MPDTSEPRWLDAEQQRDWRAFLSGVTRINEHLELALRPFGLDLAEYEILVQLSEAERRSLRMSDLAHSARQSRSRLTHTVARMESKGLVTRRACPGGACWYALRRPTCSRCARSWWTASTRRTSPRWDG